jgi:large subunit ribosomal protein L19
MAIQATHKHVMPSGEASETLFGVGDVIRVHQRLFEKGSDKSRIQIFEGTVIAIRGNGMGKSVIVRRIGNQGIGMEMIFHLFAPTIEKIELSRAGMQGVRHAKLYYIREKSKREIDKIYQRTHTKELAADAAKVSPKKSVKKASAK